MRFFDHQQRTTQPINLLTFKIALLSLLAAVGVMPVMAGFDELHTGVSESSGKPPQVEFKYRLTPNEGVAGIKVKAGDSELSPKVVQYVDQADVKTAVLFLIDTSNPRRALELVQASKLVTGVLSKADGERHVLGIYPFHGELDEQFAPMGTALPDLKIKAAEIKANGINTILYGSMLKALAVMEKIEADRKAIVVISDWKSEDNVMDTKEFVDKALKQMKTSQIICHSIVLVEEDRSELDTAEKLSSTTGGQFIKVTRQSMLVPAAFTDGFFGRLENGGSATVDLAGHEDKAKVTFEVETTEGSKYEYIYNREAKVNGAAPAATPDPSDPAVAPDAAADPDSAVDPDKGDADQPADKEEGAAAEADSVDKTSDEKGFSGMLADMMDGKDIYGIPVWAILAAIAVLVLILIIIVVMLLRSKSDEEEFDTEFVSPNESGQSAAEVNEGMDLAAGGAPPLPSAPMEKPEYPEEFELGNGVALCRTLPESGEEISAKLEFGENASRGVYPISISKTAVRIGRGSDNDLSFNNDSVSRHHAEILSKRDGSFSITDLDSGNGVFINDQEISQSALQSGDRVEIGEVAFVFQIQST